VILVIRLSISKDWVIRKLDPEFRPPLSGLSVELGVAIDQCGKEPRISPFFLGRFFLEVRDLEFRICVEKGFSVLVFLLVELRISLHGNNELEFSPRYRFQFMFELVGIPPKSLNDLGVLDAVEEFDGFPIVHHTGDGSVEGLGAKRGPDPGAKREFWRGALEADTVEGEMSVLETFPSPSGAGPSYITACSARIFMSFTKLSHSAECSCFRYSRSVTLVF
jgi:hypothetical protein